jgi:RNA polymerase sigma factor (TIGR02999 family)
MHITQLLNAAADGDPLAAATILPQVYDELLRLAHRNMERESCEHTLQPTALVHEAYLRLVGDNSSQRWDSRGHFFAAAAKSMRRILVEAARRRSSLKRGGDWIRVKLDQAPAESPALDMATLLAIDEALTRLKLIDAQCAELVDLRYFGGMTIDEAAAALGVSPRTARRNWTFARAWLQREVDNPRREDDDGS